MRLNQGQRAIVRQIQITVNFMEAVSSDRVKAVYRKHLIELSVRLNKSLEG